MSTAGFLTSSANVDTQSKPMNEKKTNDAPANMPSTLRQHARRAAASVAVWKQTSPGNEQPVWQCRPPVALKAVWEGVVSAAAHLLACDQSSTHSHPNGRKGCRFAVLPLEKPAARMMMMTTTCEPVRRFVSRVTQVSPGYMPPCFWW